MRAPGRLRADRHRLRGRARGAGLPDHAEGARRRLPDGPAAPVDPVAAPAGDPARAARDHRCGPRLLQQPRLHPGRHADLHAGGLRGHDHAVPGGVLRGHDGVPDAERPAVQRGQRDGARQGRTASARRSAPRRARRAATSPSSGWSSPRWPTPTSTTRWTWPRSWSSPSSRACSTRARPSCAQLERDTTKLETVTTPFPRITLRRGDRAARRAQGQPVEWGGDFGGTDETVLSEQFDRPVLVHRYPAE